MTLCHHYFHKYHFYPASHQQEHKNQHKVEPVYLCFRNSSAGSRLGTCSQRNLWKFQWSHGGLHKQGSSLRMTSGWEIHLIVSFLSLTFSIVILPNWAQMFHLNSQQTQHLSVSLASATLHVTAAKHTGILIIVWLNCSKIHGLKQTCALMHRICVTADLLSGREESHW